MHFNERIQIGNYTVSRELPAFIIGEAGVNHNGDVNIAEKLVDAACDAGVNAVKFQMFRAEDLILRNIAKAPYQKETTEAKQSQFDMLKGLELENEAYRRLMEYCGEKGIIFLCTPFDKGSLDRLDALGIPAYKVAATDVTNIQFLRQVAEKGKPIILSAGMCYLEEIQIALEAIYPINRDVMLLQCTANYPLSDDEVNLNVIDTLKEEFDVIVGYSDHSVGIGAAPFAVAKGAKVIEKHFTLSRSMSGPDHRASVEPDELKQLVRDIRRVETYMGFPVKVPTLSEQFTRKSLQKCLVARKAIHAGDVFSDDNVTAKRTGGEGISALYYRYVNGKKADRDYDPNDIIRLP